MTGAGGVAGKKKLKGKVGPPAPTGPTAHITPASKVVVVPKSYTSPARQPVTLSADPGFKGSAEFQSSGAAIKFFTLAAGGVEVTPANGNNVFTDAQLTAPGGVKVFAEGQSASTKIGDVELTLFPNPPIPLVGLPPVKEKMTAVELTLDIFKTRDAPGSDGAAFPQPPATEPAPGTATDKWFASRLIHVRSGTRGKRALLVVHAPKPAAFRGKLELRQVVVSGKVIGLLDGKVKLFDTEVGGAAKGNPHEFDATGSDQRFFVEGAAISGGVRDTGFQLGIKGVENDGDRIALTVFSVDKVDAKLRATPCKRDGTQADVMPAKSSTADSKTFDATAITVVRECGDLKLTGTVRPAAVPVTWDVGRAADDTGGLGALPVHSADPLAAADNKKRLLKTDAIGSFHIHAFVDVNGNGKRGADEDGIILNVNLVNIEVLAGAPNNRIIKKDTLFRKRIGVPAAILVVDSGSTGGSFAVVPPINGSYGAAEEAKHPLVMRVTVKLTGGGPSQRRGTEKVGGIERVGLGYIQQTTADSVAGTYVGARTLKEVIVVNTATPNPITVGAPAMLAFPVRDTRGASMNGTGPFIISSSDFEKANIAAGGQRRVVRFIDPPAIAIAMNHPVTGSALSSIAGSNDFDVFLCAFSSDFDENYTVIATATWSVTYGTFAVVGGWTNVGAHVTAPASMTVLAKPAPGESTNVERCPPNFVDNLRMDAR